MSWINIWRRIFKWKKKWRNVNEKEYYNNDKIKFEGEYLNGKGYGKGKEYFEHGELIFEGEFLKGERYEKGKEYF